MSFLLGPFPSRIPSHSISSSTGSSINKSFFSIVSSSWRMSITSFTAISISSLGFSNLSPVSFSKCALNLSFVIVVPAVSLCPLLHSFLRAAYIDPVFPALLALLYQLYTPLLFLLSQTPQSVPCCSQLFSCLPNYFL